MIVGLTGKYAAGKGTAAEVLGKLGFEYHSLSDILREELAARGVEESRENLLALGNELRRAGGPGVLANRLSARLQDGRNHIVDSIRNPAEVVELREVEGFVLWRIEADAKARFIRLRARNRIGDPETFEAFAELEARETESADPTTQQLRATMALADKELNNDGPIEALQAQVSELLASVPAE